MTSTQDREDYIRRVREARESANLKQEEVANHIGVDRPTYTNYEKRRAMPQKYIAKFCQKTGVRMEWLLSGTPPMKIDEYSQSAADVINQYVEGFEEDESLIAAKEAFLINLKRVREEKK